MTGISLTLTKAIAVSVAIMFAGAALSGEIDRSVTTDGLLVYYGILPARDLRDFPSGSEEAIIHSRLPKGQNVYHLIVAVFDKHDHERVTDARLWARIREPGLPWVQKSLEPHVLAGSVTFCNFFTLTDHHKYWIEIDIHRPGDSDVVTADFNYMN